ncbi:MAG: hypothetical protein ACMUIP_16295 [bacterium]
MMEKGILSIVMLPVKFIKNIYSNTVGALLSRFWHASALGKVFILTGLTASILSVFYACDNAFYYSLKSKKFIIVTSAIANIREKDSTKSRILFKVKKGAHLIQKGESKRWWYVTGKKGKKGGWISKKIAKPKKERVLLVKYKMRGYEYMLLASLMLMYTGFCLKRY